MSNEKQKPEIKESNPEAMYQTLLICYGYFRAKNEKGMSELVAQVIVGQGFELPKVDE